MKIVKEHNKSKAMCEHCKSLVETTFQYREVTLNDNSAIVENVLVGVCNSCDRVVSMPHQEANKVKAVIENN